MSILANLALPEVILKVAALKALLALPGDVTAAELGPDIVKSQDPEIKALLQQMVQTKNLKL